MNRFLNNWPLKMTAFLISLGLWSHVRGESNPLETATYSVRLDPKVPANLQLGAPVISVVRVTVRASHQELRLLSATSLPLPLPNPLAPATTEAPFVAAGALSASLDFASVAPATQSAQLVPVRVEAQSQEVEVLGVKPASVSVVLRKTR
jgi:hypothetical protein